MNQTAQRFLDTYASGGEIEGGWKFAKALQQAQLDFSDAGLNRLDQLLTAIRTRAKPTAHDMQQTPEGQHFCSLIAFHVVDVVRRRTTANLDWHDRASALRALPPGTQLPDGPCSRLFTIFPDQGVLFMPLSWVEEQVLGGGTLTKASDFVASLVQQIERDGPAVWWTGMHALGRLASWQMMMAADGGSVVPMMLRSTAPMTFVALMTGFIRGEDLQEAVERGGRDLDENPDGSVWQVLAYDGITEIDGKRVDAVMVVLNTYGKSPLKLKIAFPYCPAVPGQAFAILSPTMRGGNVENETVSMLGEAMERGIQSVKWPFGTTWNQLRVNNAW